MSLDVHTILVMFAMLAFLFSGLLALAGLHEGSVGSGVRQWALASLLISLGFLPAYFYPVPAPGYEWAMVLGTTLVANPNYRLSQLLYTLQIVHSCSDKLIT